MKQFYLLIFVLMLCYTTEAQNAFSDDFESYTAGQFLGPQSPKWTTWGAADGGADDVKVSDKKASSGKNSLYFSSTAASGGPSDVILPFEDAFSKDLFEFSTKIFVDNNKTGYFNFQAEKKVGTTWAMDINFTQDKMITIAAGGSNVLTATYEQDKWFTFTIKGNISTNRWTALVDGVEIGKFKLATNKVASIDFYPANANASYYIDDVSYKTEVYVAKPNDVSAGGVSLPTRDLTGSKTQVGIIVTNEGTNEVNDVKVEYTVDGVTLSKNATNLKLGSFKSTVINFDDLYTVKAGANNFAFSASLLSATDDDASNNSITAQFTGVTPAADKYVVAEEATGTWCQWCPRGAVMLDRMAKKYPNYFIGIAAHNNDPMALSEYDKGMTALPGFTGFPGAIVNRTAVIDPTDIENQFFTRITEPTKSVIKVGASYDEATRTLKISPEVTFKSNVGAYKLMVVIVEDSVRGTTSGYAQSNAYSGGGAGPMGGYELLPNPVPANKMVYNHVARILLGTFKGTALPQTSYKKDDKVLMNFETVLPTTINKDKLHIIPVLFATSGLIDNAYQATIDEAVANGFTVGTDDELDTKTPVYVYPNPSSFETIIDLDLEKSEEVEVRIIDMTGKVVGSKSYGQLSGKQKLEVNSALLQNGSYIARINIGKKVVNKNIIVQH